MFYTNLSGIIATSIDSSESVQPGFRPIGSNLRVVQPLAHSGNLSAHFSVVWIGSCSTFVLCTALLTAEYTEGDRAQSEGQQRPQAL